MSLITPFYRRDYVGETINRLVDGKTYIYVIKPRINAFTKSNVTSAIVLGNGITRNYPEHKHLLKINSKKLAESYKLVYACNRAITEEQTYDYYVLKHRVFLSGIKKERMSQVYLPNNICLDYSTECNMLPFISYYDSGSSAAMLAAFDGHKRIFLMGFDGDLGAGWQTIYDNTFPYNENNADVSLKAWKDYMTEVIRAYSDVEFYRLQSDGQEAPIEWQSLPNFRDVTFREAVLLGDF
jgi:hypothetical protein